MSIRKRNKAHYRNMGIGNGSKYWLDRLLARVLERAETVTPE